MAAVAAVIGHCHPPWLGGKGGKGVATALGVFLGLGWGVFATAAVTWLAAAYLSKISSVGALSAMAVASTVSFFVLAPDHAFAVAIIALYVAIRHRENIKRLLAGEEPRIGQKK
jgi:glycerol-3-phosphate acyltransferase PlsY